MDRDILTYAQWAKIEPFCLGKPGDPDVGEKQPAVHQGGVVDRADGQPVARSAGAARSLGAPFRRFRDWREAEVFKRIFDALSHEPDMEYAMVGAMIVKVHRHVQGAKGGTRNQAIGRSRGGMTTRIPALTDALRNPVRFRLMPGQRHDSVEVPPPIDCLAFDGLIADKVFDSNALVAELNGRCARVVISQHPGRAKKLEIDAAIYTWRHLIENFFCKLKELKRIAMRACKTDRSFEIMIYLAAAIINSR